MTDAELTELFVVLDQLWGGVDEGREEGYRWLLADKDGELVARAVRELAAEGRQWLPKPPEVAARVADLERERRVERHLRDCRERIVRRLESEDQLGAMVDRAREQLGEEVA